MKNDLHGRRRLAAGTLLTALLCAGCASVPAPDAQLAVSRSAIDDAMNAGAAASAPQELRQAREKMARADAAVAAENYTVASSLAQQAELDARLAAAKARTARSETAALEVEQGIRVLRESLDANAVANSPTRRTP